VGGRLDRSPFLSDAATHPLLLRKKSHLSTLICNYYHKILFHSGPRSTAVNIQKKFWIPSIISILRGVISKCIPCHRLSAKPIQPKMADVLPERMQRTYPFASCAMEVHIPLKRAIFAIIPLIKLISLSSYVLRREPSI